MKNHKTKKDILSMVRFCSKIQFPRKNLSSHKVCYEWKGQIRPSGYGNFSLNHVTMTASRASYLLFVGKIPKGYHIDHLCRNVSCVNPLHLEAVTPRENLLRGNAPCAITVRTNICKNGHKLTKNNVYYNKNHPTYRKCAECVKQNLKRFRSRLSGQ